MANTELKKRVWGWMAFDWAAQPFYTLGWTFIFAPYFAVVATQYFMGTGLDEATADAQSQALWSWGQTATGLLIAITAPFIGAYADSSGRRIPYVVGFSILFVLSACFMWVLQPDGTGLYLALAMFCVAFIAAEFALIFTNALLPSLGPSDEVGKISGAGLAIGYAGGVVSLVIMLLFFAEGDAGKTFIGLDPILGLDADAREGTRSVGPFTALWFALFMIPFFLWVREDKSQHQKTSVSTALSELRLSFGSIVKRRSLACYLGSSMFYRDALNGLYSFGGVYAALVLDWSITMIGVFGITGALAATLFTYVGGVCDKRFGPKPVIIFCLFALVSVCISLVAMSREMFFGIPLSQGSAVPDIVMYICGAVIGGAGGALQGASRSLMVRHADPERPTEAFGFFALSGKATAFLAPALIGITTTITNSPRLGIAPVVGLFLLGLILLRWVNPKGEVYETST